VGIPVVTITLAPIDVPVHADRRLAFQVITAFGAGAKDSGESSKVLERGGDRVLVEFHSPVKGLLGRTKVYKTVEWVTPHEPDRVDFEHVNGPLEVMHDRFLLEEVEGGCMTLRYESEFAVRWWWPGWVIGMLYVRPTLRKMMSKHLMDMKETIEERARRSHLFPACAHTTDDVRTTN
jgi:hypothetical protein